MQYYGCVSGLNMARDERLTTSQENYFSLEYGKEVIEYLNNQYPKKLRDRQKPHNKIPKKFRYKHEKEKV